MCTRSRRLWPPSCLLCAPPALLCACPRFPEFPLPPLKSWGGWCRGQTGEGLNALETDKGDDSRTATLLPPYRCSCLAPFALAFLLEVLWSRRQEFAPGQEHESLFNKFLSYLTLVNQNVGEEKQSLFFFFFIWVIVKRKNLKNYFFF